MAQHNTRGRPHGSPILLIRKEPYLKIIRLPLNRPIVPTTASTALSRALAPLRALTIRSTAEAIASAKSAPLIFVSLCRPFHVGFTKDVSLFRVRSVGQDHEGLGPRNTKRSEGSAQHSQERTEGGRKASPDSYKQSGFTRVPDDHMETHRKHGVTLGTRKSTVTRNLRNSVSSREHRNAWNPDDTFPRKLCVIDLSLYIYTRASRVTKDTGTWKSAVSECRWQQDGDLSGAHGRPAEQMQPLEPSRSKRGDALNIFQ
jgi:hypothetical protein